MIHDSATTMLEILARWRESKPLARAYVFLDNNGDPLSELTYAELDERSAAVAGVLQQCVGVGQRAVLMYPAGPDFITAFMGCLRAGVIAVPVRAPHPARPMQTLSQLSGILDDAAPDAVLATSELAGLCHVLSEKMPRLARCRWLATDRIAATGTTLNPFRPNGETIALLQYTSGSTDAPRGVIVSHRNLVKNLDSIYRFEENDATSVSLTWLPHYHDMGLVESLLQPFFGGYPCYQLAPMSFLRRPLLWLECISKYRATNSGAPNFAYDLCVDRARDESIDHLDLAAWRVAYNGAEPVRSETLQRFYACFRASGFRWKAFYPVYGLAEATLVVSSGRQSTAPVILEADSRALGQDQLVTSRSNRSTTVKLVSSGRIAPMTDVAIVDPHTCQRRVESEVGEIWVRGPGVSRGYWNQPSLNRRTFQAHVAGSGDGPYLRTGDLGIIRHGELFVTGRLKDVIIIRGRKHYAQDIESTVVKCHESVRACASFPVCADDSEQLVVIAELERGAAARRQSAQAGGGSAGRTDFDSVISVIRQFIAERHEVDVACIVLVAPGRIPRTTSGKVRRRSCRDLWLQGKIDAVVEWSRADVRRLAEARTA